jgi:hypothetical protein
LDKQLRADRVEIRVVAVEIAENCCNLSEFSASSRYFPYFGRGHECGGGAGDCFSNRLYKARSFASYERPAPKPTCTAENFFHT